jgi:hypothetical protein
MSLIVKGGSLINSQKPKIKFITPTIFTSNKLNEPNEPNKPNLITKCKKILSAVYNEYNNNYAIIIKERIFLNDTYLKLLNKHNNKSKSINTQKIIINDINDINDINECEQKLNYIYNLYLKQNTKISTLKAKINKFKKSNRNLKSKRHIKKKHIKKPNIQLQPSLSSQPSLSPLSPSSHIKLPSIT